MKISVAICTWNRAPLLDQTLTAMTHLTVPSDLDWELLIVNNRCSDETDDVIRKHANHLPLKRLYEERQGHSNARNCAVAEARGELLIWTDDDVLVDRNWLCAYLDAATAWPRAGFFGGPIQPWFGKTPPRWMIRHLEHLAGPFALLDLGNEPHSFGPDEYPFGANMAFRRGLVADARFDPALGRVGLGLISGDDTAFIQRLRERGVEGVWVPPATVQHYVAPERLKLEYIRKWYRGGGRTSVRMKEGGPAKMLWNVPRWAWRQYVQSTARMWAGAWSKGPGWLAAMQRAAIARGVIEESRSGRTAHER